MGEWTIIHQQTYLVNRLENGKYNPISEQLIPINYPRIMVGINCPKAFIEWRLGAWISVQHQLSIVSDFGNWVDIYTGVLLIQRLVLIDIDTNLGTLPYRLRIKIPHWHEEIYLEVWEQQ